MSNHISRTSEEQNAPKSTDAPIQSITNMGLVRCGITPRCITFSARVARALPVPESDPVGSDKRGNSPSHARVKTALCEGSECRDWCSVSVCRRAPVIFALFSSSGVGSSSKNLRQSSSSSPSFFVLVSSSSLSDKLPLFFGVCLGLGGFVPISETHQALSSECSVGKVVSFSRMERRFEARFGLFSWRVLWRRVLLEC